MGVPSPPPPPLGKSGPGEGKCERKNWNSNFFQAQLWNKDQVTICRAVIRSQTKNVNKAKVLLNFFPLSDFTTLHYMNAWARFTKVPIINGPRKLLSFTFKIEVSAVLQVIIWENYQWTRQNGVVRYVQTALFSFRFWLEYLILGPKSYRDFQETVPWNRLIHYMSYNFVNHLMVTFFSVYRALLSLNKPLKVKSSKSFWNWNNLTAM